MNERKNSVFDGILGDNLVLASLMVISPVIICGDPIKMLFRLYMRSIPSLSSHCSLAHLYRKNCLIQ